MHEWPERVPIEEQPFEIQLEYDSQDSVLTFVDILCVFLNIHFLCSSFALRPMTVTHPLWFI